jgi:hypothetical protein
MAGIDSGAPFQRVEEMEQEIEVLPERLEEPKEDIDRLRRENEELRKELKAAGRETRRGRQKPKAQPKPARPQGWARLLYVPAGLQPAPGRTVSRRSKCP